MIKNGKDFPFDQITSGLPDVSQAIIQFFQPVTVGIISSTQIDGYTQSLVARYIKTSGVRTQRQNNLVISKTGQRIWDSVDIYFLSDVILKADDIFLFQDIQYRVIVVDPWTEYGYNHYACVQDFTNISLDPQTP